MSNVLAAQLWYNSLIRRYVIMKIKFLGAAHEVTGSMTLVECGGKYIMVDCGMEQGRNVYENALLPVNAAEISCLVLTHAHVDHSGNIPLLYKNGFRGKIYATEDTAELCRIMLGDCAHIKESEAEWTSRKAMRAGEETVAAEYSQEDVDGAMELFEPVRYGKTVWILPSVSVRFTDAGHFLGSASIEMVLREGDAEKKIVFSGDLGNKNLPIIKDPGTVLEADWLVLESTYGARDHDPDKAEEDPVRRLAGILQDTFDRGGNVIIPAYAVGRTQEMLYYIRQVKERGLVHGHGGFPVIVDGPLSAEATAVFRNCSRACLDEEALAMTERGVDPIGFKGLRTVVTQEESKRLNTDPTPKVIIASSGMCDAGRIRHHLKHNLWNPDSTVLFSGYQSEGTLGRRIWDGADTVKLFGETIAVRAHIELLPSVSGHADRSGLLEWVDALCQIPEMIFINHGDDENSSALESALKEKGYSACVPFSGTAWDLASGECIYEAEGVRAAGRGREAVKTVFERLLEAIGKLTSAVPKASGFRGNILEGYISKINSIINDIERR